MAGFTAEVEPLIGGRSPEQKKGKSYGIVQTLLNVAFVPWLTFTLTGLLFLVCFHYLRQLVFLLLVCWAALCICGLIFGRRQKGPDEKQGLERSALLLCLVAICSGSVIGYWNYSKTFGVSDFWEISEHRQYTNVWPDELADAHRDASILVFAQGSRPDLRLTAWYSSSSEGKFCVSPIITKTEEYSGVMDAQYFIAGKDCCGTHEFTCGDVEQPGAHAGIVLQPKTDYLHAALFGKPDIDYYTEAAKMSGAKYGIEVTKQPIFVEWVADIKAAEMRMWDKAKHYCLYSSLLSLPVLFALALAMQAAESMSKSKGGELKDDKADPAV